MALQLRKDFGFPVDEEIKQVESTENKESTEEMKNDEEKPVDFGYEVDELIATMPWRKQEAESKRISQQIETLDQKRLFGIFKLLQLLTPQGNINSLLDTPFISSIQSDVEKIEIFQAVILQCLFQIKNSDRVEAITSGSYSEIKLPTDAESYLGKCIKVNMMNWLKS